LRSAALGLDAWGTDASSVRRKAFEESLLAIDRVDQNNPWDEILLAIVIDTAEYIYGVECHQKAFEMLTAVLVRDDLTPTVRAVVLAYRAQSLGAMGKLSESLEDLEKAIPLAPTYETTYSVLASTLMYMGRRDEALNRARQAVALNPLSFQTHVFLSWILSDAGMLEEALVHARRAVELGPDNFQNHLGLGEVLWKLERWEESAVHYGKACELSPVRGTCAARAASLRRAGRESEEARKVAAALPESPWGAYFLAIYSADAGNRVEALRLLQRSWELNEGATKPGDVEDLRDNFPSLHGDSEFEAIVAEVKRRSGAQE
jgi:tetratricopeptide (TPR) repeat protein